MMDFYKDHRVSTQINSAFEFLASDSTEVSTNPDRISTCKLDKACNGGAATATGESPNVPTDIDPHDADCKIDKAGLNSILDMNCDSGVQLRHSLNNNLLRPSRCISDAFRFLTADDDVDIDDETESDIGQPCTGPCSGEALHEKDQCFPAHNSMNIHTVLDSAPTANGDRKNSMDTDQQTQHAGHEESLQDNQLERKVAPCDIEQLSGITCKNYNTIVTNTPQVLSEEPNIYNAMQVLGACESPKQIKVNPPCGETFTEPGDRPNNVTVCATTNKAAEDDALLKTDFLPCYIVSMDLESEQSCTAPVVTTNVFNGDRNESSDDTPVTCSSKNSIEACNSACDTYSNEDVNLPSTETVKDKPPAVPTLGEQSSKTVPHESTEGDASELYPDVTVPKVLESPPDPLNTQSPAPISPSTPHSPSTDNVVVRRKALKSESMKSVDSSEEEDDDEDEDVYMESYRTSKWIYTGSDGELSVFKTSSPDTTSTSIDRPADGLAGSTRYDLNATDSGIVEESNSQHADEVFDDTTDYDCKGARATADQLESCMSTSSTVSEKEYRQVHRALTMKIIQRQTSKQKFFRKSQRVHETDRHVVVIKRLTDADFGFRIHGCNPVLISTVTEGGAADVVGVEEGHIIISVNGNNVLALNHSNVINLILQYDDRVALELSHDTRDTESTSLKDPSLPLCEGYLLKQGGAFHKSWKKRWFILKQDNCLYYFHNEQDVDPLGAILLTNYTITKTSETKKKFAFKANKYGGGKTYYFVAESEEDRNRWASAMNDASAKYTSEPDVWLDVSSHNVSLPAMSIHQPDCYGFLVKMGNRMKTWRRRYCVLKNACLYYYQDMNSATAKGVAHLHGYSVKEFLPMNKKNSFSLIPPETRMRTFCFYTEKSSERERWATALQASIGKWVMAE